MWKAVKFAVFLKQNVGTKLSTPISLGRPHNQFFLRVGFLLIINSLISAVILGSATRECFVNGKGLPEWSRFIDTSGCVSVLLAQIDKNVRNLYTFFESQCFTNWVYPCNNPDMSASKTLKAILFMIGRNLITDPSKNYTAKYVMYDLNSESLTKFSWKQGKICWIFFQKALSFITSTTLNLAIIWYQQIKVHSKSCRKSTHLPSLCHWYSEKLHFLTFY